MIDIMLLLMAVSHFLLSGGCVLFFLNRLKPAANLYNFEWPFIIFLMYSLGTGVVSLQIFLYSLFHIPLSRVGVFLPWGLIIAIIFLLRFRQDQISLRKMHRSPVRGIRNSVTWFEGFLFFIIALQIIYFLVYAMSWPLVGWDAWTFWFFKAKAFYLANGMPPDWFFLNPGPNPGEYMHPDYPLLTPLSVTWIYVSLGKIDEQLAKLIFVLNAIALLAIFYYMLKQHINRLYALLFTSLLSITPVFIRHAGGTPIYDAVGLADLTLSMYILGAATFFHFYHRSKAAPFLMLFFLFLGMAGWTKNEGLTFALFGSLIAVTGNVEKKNLLWGLLLMSAFIAPWQLYKVHLAIPGEYIGLSDPLWRRMTANVERLPFVFKMMVMEFFNLKKFGLIWPVFLLTIFLNWRKTIRYPLSPCILFIFSQILVYGFIYYITPHDIKWQMRTSVDRIVLHLSPLALWIAAMCADELFDTGKAAGNSIRSGNITQKSS